MKKVNSKTWMRLGVVAVVIASPFVSDWRVKKKVNAFCDTIHAGDPVKNLKAKSRREGLNILSNPALTGGSIPKDKLRPVIVWDGIAFSRWNCVVEHDGSQVLKTSLVHMD